MISPSFFLMPSWMRGRGVGLRDNHAGGQPRNDDAYKMSKIEGRYLPRTAIAARKPTQAIENTYSFSRSELALPLYTMAHRLLRSGKISAPGVQSVMANLSHANPARAAGRMPVLIEAARD
jgi:hypothetical protein